MRLSRPCVVRMFSLDLANLVMWQLCDAAAHSEDLSALGVLIRFFPVAMFTLRALCRSTFVATWRPAAPCYLNPARSLHGSQRLGCFSKSSRHWGISTQQRQGRRLFSTQGKGKAKEQEGGIGIEEKVEKTKHEAEGLVQSPEVVENLTEKPDNCTGDELHYVSVAEGKWKLALWRYRPLPSAPVRNHPLLLLSGVATNALGFDLDPRVSFARYMAEQGFDTWVLEMRGSGLSKKEEDSDPSTLSSEIHQVASTASKEEPKLSSVIPNIEKKMNGSLSSKLQQAASTKSKREPEHQELDAVPPNIDKEDSNKGNGSLSDDGSSTKSSSSEGSSSWEITKTASQLSSTVTDLAHRLRAVVNEGQSRVLSARFAEQISSILEDFQLSHRYHEIKDRLMSLLVERRNLVFTTQLTDLSNRLTRLLEEAQVSVSRVKNLQEKLSITVDDFQKFLELILTYDWDFDHYVEEDVPAAVNYVRSQCKPKDGKLFGLGHSMGGIILYALLASQGQRSGLAAVVTVASSLDYSACNSSLKMLLPLADPAQLLNVPVVPLGTIMQAVYPLVSRPPYALAWLGYNVSANGMMDPDLYEKLVLNNFCTVPAKLILHLTTLFQPGGLKSRDGSMRYKDSLSKCDVPILALAGDEDLICPPSAVVDTVNTLPLEFGKYEIFGGRHDKHYGHYDLLVSRTAKAEVYPVVLKFFEKHDEIEEQSESD